MAHASISNGKAVSRRTFTGIAAVSALAAIGAGAIPRPALAGILDTVLPGASSGGASEPAAQDDASAPIPWPSRRYVATPALGSDGMSHLFIVENGMVLDPVPLSKTYSCTLLAGMSGRVCYRLAEVVGEDGAWQGFAISVLDDSGERTLVEGGALPFGFSADDSLALLYTIGEIGSITLYDVASAQAVFSETNVPAAMLSPNGTYLYYTYSDYKTLCRRNVATGDEVDIDDGVEQILLGSDDGMCAYSKVDPYSEEPLDDAAASDYLTIRCFDGAGIKDVVLVPEIAQYDGDPSELAGTLNVSLDSCQNADSTELLYRYGDLLTRTQCTMVYALGEDAPRVLSGGWAGDWDHASRYATFLDPALTVDDPFSEAILRDWILSIVGLPAEEPFVPTFDTPVMPSWTADNRWLFYVADGCVYLHEMGAIADGDAQAIGGGNDVLLYGGDALMVHPIEDGSTDPYIVLADGTFGRLRGGAVVPLMGEGDMFQNLFWAPLNGKLAIVEKNGNLDLVDPADDSVVQVDKMTAGAELIDDVLVYMDQDEGVFAVGADGTAVKI